MQQLCMDATISMNKTSNVLLDQVSHLDEIKQADLADDPYMVAALKALVHAKEEPNSDAKQGFIEEALSAIETACNIDFADTTIEEAKAALIPAIKSVDSCKQNFLDLQGKLARKASVEGEA